MNKWNAEANENQQLDSGGPDQSQSVRHEPTYLLKYLCRSRHRVWGPTRRRATIEGSKVNNRWVNYHACSLSYYIYVISNIFYVEEWFS